MRLSTIIRQARSGELKGLSPVDKTDEVIIDFINLAMIALYSKFQLRTEEAIITLKTNKVNYKLLPTDLDVKVNGLPIPLDDVMQIIEAFNEKGSIPINDDNHQLSIYTVGYDTIQVPSSLTGDYISIIYKKNPTEILYEVDGNGALVDSFVDLPNVLLEPLLCYIGFRGHSSVVDSVNGEASVHWARYNESLKRVEDSGFITADAYSIDINKRGYL